MVIINCLIFFLKYLISLSILKHYLHGIPILIHSHLFSELSVFHSILSWLLQLLMKSLGNSDICVFVYKLIFFLMLPIGLLLYSVLLTCFQYWAMQTFFYSHACLELYIPLTYRYLILPLSLENFML